MASRWPECLERTTATSAYDPVVPAEPPAAATSGDGNRIEIQH